MYEYYKEKHRRFIDASKKTGLEVHTEKTKYVVMSSEQKSEESHKIKICNKYLDGVKHLKIFEQTYQIKSTFVKKLKAG
jgi:hypothetical protein